MRRSNSATAASRTPFRSGAGSAAGALSAIRCTQPATTPARRLYWSMCRRPYRSTWPPALPLKRGRLPRHGGALQRDRRSAGEEPVAPRPPGVAAGRAHHHVRRALRAGQPRRQRAAGAGRADGAAGAALHARHARSAGCVLGSDEGGPGAGARQHAAHHRRLRLPGARQPRARAGGQLRAPAQARAGASRAALPAVGGRFGRIRARARDAGRAARTGAQRPRSGSDDPRRRGVLALFERLHRPAEGGDAPARRSGRDRAVVR